MSEQRDTVATIRDMPLRRSLHVVIAVFSLTATAVRVPSSCLSARRVAISPCMRATDSRPPPPPPPSPPPQLSRVLLIGDAGAMLLYSLSLSTARTLAQAGPTFTFMQESTLHLTYQYVAIEQLSAVALTLAWCVGAAYAGGLSQDWFERAREARDSSPNFGVLRSLLSSWATAVPLAATGKTIAVAAVILPVGGWLAFDLPTAVMDLGGMLLAVALWRTMLLRMTVL